MKVVVALLVCVGLLATSAPAIAQDGDRATVLIGLARVKKASGHLSEAARYFEQARALHPLSVGELTEYFWTLRDEPRQALRIGMELLDQNPVDAGVRDGVVSAAIALNDEAAVRRLAAEGQRIHASTARWPRRLGESLLRSGATREAAAAFRQAAEAPDGMPEDRLQLAVALSAAGDFYGGALEWLHVAPALIADRADLQQIRLHVLSQGAAPQVAAPALESWLTAHPDDHTVREWLVELWHRAGDERAALAAIGPLTDGPAAETWLRRAADLARASGLTRQAVHYLEALVKRPAAEWRDRRTLAELLFEIKNVDRAVALIDQMTALSAGCDADLPVLMDRVPDLRGTDRLRALLDDPRCPLRGRWRARVVERAIAEQRHREALEVVRHAPPAERPTFQKSEGQLLLWTGDVVAAAPLLETFVVQHPDDVEARLALVDAQRAVGRPQVAWTAAQPLLGQPLPGERVASLIELALEVEAHPAIPALVAALPATTLWSRRGLNLFGRSLVQQGHTAEAIDVLSAVPVDELSPAGALALLDATLALRGVAAATAMAERFATAVTDPAWADVSARRLMLALVTGNGPLVSALERALRPTSVDRIALANAEARLTLEDPVGALEALEGVVVSSDRVEDLRATALAGVGNYEQAAAIVQRLLVDAPGRSSLLVKHREWLWKAQQSESALAAVVALSTQFPHDIAVAIGVARVLQEAGRHANAMALVEPFTASSSEARLIAARSLHASGDSRRALALLDATLVQLSTSAALLRAQAQLVVEGRAAAIASLTDLSRLPRPEPQVYSMLATLMTPGDGRRATLERAVEHFPSRVDFIAALAVERLQANDAQGARRDAAKALALDPSSIDAWAVTIDVAATSPGASEAAALIARLDVVAAENPRLLVAIGDHIGRRARVSLHPVERAVIQRLEQTPSHSALMVSALLTAARIHAALEEWPVALAAIDRVLARDRGDATALRLKADVLGWSGRHGEAIEAYTHYLRQVPTDLEAARLRARVAGWGGRYDEARRLYASLRSANPQQAIVAAEADAKGAFFDGRWRAATAAYDRWLRLEPDNGEARFERAAALRNAGLIAQADDELRVLDRDTGHRLAALARERQRVLSRPEVAVIDQQRSAQGFQGARLLNLQVAGGAVANAFGSTGRFTLMAEGARVDAASQGVTRQGTRVRTAARLRAGSRLWLDAAAGVWSFDRGLTSELRLQSSWTPADRWTVGGGYEREAIQDNVASLDRRLTAAGPFASARLNTARTTFDVRATTQRLTDGNSRGRLSLSAGRVLSERMRPLRIFGWAELLDYKTRSAVYFAPSQFLRADAGAEYTFAFAKPQFDGDRMSGLTLSYAEGFDDRGTRYHHPTGRLAVEFADWLAINVEAGWVKAATYDEKSFGVRVRLGGASRN